MEKMKTLRKTLENTWRMTGNMELPWIIKGTQVKINLLLLPLLPESVE
jgi:hypothetical protein